jgi:hypothetical protein
MRLPLGTLLATLLIPALAVSLVPSEAAGDADATIGVRGHWVVEVRDPDGTPVTRQEFHNALADTGLIPRILAGQITLGPLHVVMDCLGPGCTKPCSPPGDKGLPCRIFEPRFKLPASSSIFKSLQVSTVPGGFKLVGSATVSSNTTISTFTAAIQTCDAKTTTTANCGVATEGVTANLTTTVQPTTVVVGQQVQVTVTITFATATAPATPQSVAPPR